MRDCAVEERQFENQRWAFGIDGSSAFPALVMTAYQNCYSNSQNQQRDNGRDHDVIIIDQSNVQRFRGLPNAPNGKCADARDHNKSDDCQDQFD